MAYSLIGQTLMSTGLIKLHKDLVVEVDVDGIETRWLEISTSCLKRADKIPHYHGFYRCIGGDRGDLLFNGANIVSDTEVELIDATVNTGYDFNNDELEDLALEIFQSAYESIGVEVLY